MVECNWCKKEMTDPKTRSCNPDGTVDFPDGSSLPPIPYDVNEERRCHDCGVSPGGVHHPGCDMERCPKCGGQLISCGCLDPDEEDDEGGDYEAAFDKKIDKLRHEHDPEDAAAKRLQKLDEE